MNKVLLSFAAIGVFALQGFAQESKTEFKASGKPTIRIFSNYHTTSIDGKSLNQFEITRAYLGYEHQFSQDLRGVVLYDVGNPGAGSFQMSAFVKLALLEYRKDNLKVGFGLIDTKHFKAAEDQWGYRYMYKSFQDEYSISPSADLGVSAEYAFSDLISADFSIHNGEGYKKVEADSALKYCVGVTVNPLKGLWVRGYYDYMDKKFDNANTAQQTTGISAGYKAGKLVLGADYTYQYNQGRTTGKDIFGTSVYGTYAIGKQSKLFARFDDLSSSKIGSATDSWNVKKDGQLYMVGYEYSPVKGVKITPNFQSFDRKSATANSVYVNVEVRF
jgi:hypothetical protein